MGRSLVEVVDMVDEDKRIVSIVGWVNANPALRDRYFNNYVSTLETSDLFYSVEIIKKDSRKSSGKSGGIMKFEIRCYL